MDSSAPLGSRFKRQVFCPEVFVFLLLSVAICCSGLIPHALPPTDITDLQVSCCKPARQCKHPETADALSEYWRFHFSQEPPALWCCVLAHHISVHLFSVRIQLTSHIWSFSWLKRWKYFTRKKQKLEKHQKVNTIKDFGFWAQKHGVHPTGTVRCPYVNPLFC